MPRQLRVDNGPELVSAKLVAWCEQIDIRLHHIQPGRPMQNGYVERFNRSFRNEVLDAHVFASLGEVREHVHQWLISYNAERPHESLGNIPPALFRQQQTNPETARKFSVRNVQFEGKHTLTPDERNQFSKDARTAATLRSAGPAADEEPFVELPPQQQAAYEAAYQFIADHTPPQ